MSGHEGGIPAAGAIDMRMTANIPTASCVAVGMRMNATIPTATPSVMRMIIIINLILVLG